MDTLTYEDRFESEYQFDRDIAEPNFSPKERARGVIGLGISQAAYIVALAYGPIAPKKHKEAITELKRDLPPQIKAFKLAVLEGMLDTDFMDELAEIQYKECSACPHRKL